MLVSAVIVVGVVDQVPLLFATVGVASILYVPVPNWVFNSFWMSVIFFVLFEP